MENIAENLKKISIFIEDAMKKSSFGQPVKVIAVTKTFGPEVVYVLEKTSFKNAVSNLRIY